MTLQELRRDIRLACISSFATNFLGYFGYDLDIEVSLAFPASYAVLLLYLCIGTPPPLFLRPARAGLVATSQPRVPCCDLEPTASEPLLQLYAPRAPS